MKKQKTEKLRTNKGITLIALVITIIVMLILVAVTISMAVNGGLFEYASNAGTQTNAAVDAEQELAGGKVEIDGKWYNNIDDYLNNKPLVILPEGIKVGDYVNYTPTAGIYKVAGGENGSGSAECQTFETEVDDETTIDVNEALQWRILSIDEETGEIELVSATVAQSSTKLLLFGVNGYNHAVDILNDLCKELYSNENGATARSINVEDINSKTTYDPTKDTRYSSEYDTEIRYSTRNYGTDNRKYPKLYEKEEGFYVNGNKQPNGISGSIGLKDGVTDANGVTTYSTVTGYADDWDEAAGDAKKDVSVTCTYYWYVVENCLDSNLGINIAPEGLLNTGTVYWLASRYVIDNGGYCNFGLRSIASNGSVSSEGLFSSNNSAGFPKRAVRPVVTLKAGVKLTPAANKINNSTTWDVQF